ncbi:LysR family transcriptional regulator, partial [Aeromonas caviae]
MLDRIRILAQVVESGSFSRAARALNQAPSSVTRAIDALEQQLGIPLFKRSTRQLVLTEQGAYFLARSLPLLEEADQLVQSLQPLSVAPE